MRAACAGLLLSMLACGAKGDGAESAEPSGTAKPSAPSSTTASAKPSTSVSAKPSAKPNAAAPPAKLTQPIRENVAKGAVQGGAALEARLFVSKVTTADPVRLALRFRVDAPPIDKAVWDTATISLADFVRSMRFELTGPGGKTVLEADDGLGTESLGVGWMDLDLTLTEEGIRRYDKLAAWKKPSPGLFAKPGKYSIALSGNPTFGTKSVKLSLEPLAFELVAPSPEWKSLVDLTKDAAELVKNRREMKAAPQSFTTVIDDVADNRWFRFRVDTEGASNRSHYDVDIVEVLLDPAGKEQNFDTFPHFTCVAEGVSITTPTGRVPIESLQIGDEVVSWDPALRVKTVATVEHITASHAEELLSFGELRVTGTHPIFADDAFRAAATIAPTAQLFGEDLVSRTVTRSEREVPATVYDLDVSPPNTYFAGGFLVHNKAVAEVVGGRNQPFDGWFYRRAVER